MVSLYEYLLMVSNRQPSKLIEFKDLPLSWGAWFGLSGGIVHAFRHRRFKSSRPTHNTTGAFISWHYFQVAECRVNRSQAYLRAFLIMGD